MKGNSRLFSGTPGVWTLSTPSYVYDLYDKIIDNNGTPPKGYKGGKPYKNKPAEGEAKLPDGNYKEYDVHPHVKGQDRGEDRLVIDDEGNAYYTDSHYKSFIKLDFDKKD